MADICSICRDDLNQGDLAVFDCVHIHHNLCINRWLSRRVRARWSCPLCRVKIREIQVIKNPDNGIPDSLSSESSGPVSFVNETETNSQPSSSQGSSHGPEIEVIDISSDSEDSDAFQIPPTLPNSPASLNNEIGFNSESNPQYFEIQIRPLGPSSHSVPEITGIIIGEPPGGTSNEYIILQPAENPEPNPTASSSGEGSSRELSDSSFSTPGNVATQIPMETQSNSAARSADGGGISGNLFVCSVCQAPFRLRNSLYRHMSRHHQRRPFTCRFPSCGQSFSNRSSLDIHMEEHFDEMFTSSQSSK